MSVAAEFAPVLYAPAPARRDDRPPAEVVALYRPSERSIAAPLRLTRRGVAVLAIAVAVVAVALVAIAALSAPGSGAAARGTAAATVTVRPGDTLWAIAGRVAPQADPRAEVARLQHLNGLAGVDLVVGQQLRLR